MVIVCFYVSRHQLRSVFQTPPVGFILFLPVVLLMGARATVFPEFTHDSHTYGLVRLGLWMNYQSLLIHMPTDQLNVFSNEWIGELLALLYGLSSHNIQGFMFGNVEILLVLYLSAAFLIRQLRENSTWAFIYAAVVATTPASLGLTGTTKGDLLSFAAVLLAAGWIVVLYKSVSLLAVSMSMSSITIAVGSKITTALLCLILAISFLMILYRERKSSRTYLYLAAGLALSLPLASRQISNLIVYGNPLQRVSIEKPDPNLENIFHGLNYVFYMFFHYSPNIIGQPAFGWLLSGGLGITAIFSVIVFISRLGNGQSLSRIESALVASAAFSVLALTYVINVYPFSFRYFAPSILILIICLASKPVPTIERSLLVLASFAAYSNAYYVFWPGEINGNNTFMGAIDKVISLPAIERTVIQYPPIRSDYGMGVLSIDDKTPKLIAVHQYLDRPVAGLLGSHAQNRLIYFQTEQDLINSLREECYHYVALTERVAGPISESIVNALTEQGYDLKTDGEMISIAENMNSCGQY